MTNQMSEYDRAVYDLVDVGAVGPAQAPLYRRALGKLHARGLITKTESGEWRTVRAPTDRRGPASIAPPAAATPAPPQEPEREPHGVLVVRVPQSWLDTLDSRGESRSAVVRAILGRALAAGSGTRKTGT